MNIRAGLLCLAAAMAAGVHMEAQFRRGLFSEATEITLYPHEPPALLLPAGSIQVEVRNASGATARIVERIESRMQRQLPENDSRLQVAPAGGNVVVVATLTEWNEARRNSTKYVAETRQVGTRQVTDKSGKTRSEPVYEYGRNRPSVVINATAAMRLEVRQGRGGALAEEIARHTIQEEYLLEAGPPSREEIEDQLIDRIVQKAAGRISPGRSAVRVMLARSDEVDKLNTLAQNRKWDEWVGALETLKPHSNRSRDAYRLHNLAVAHEALAYEATTIEDWAARLRQASSLISRASAQNPKERYITEAVERITRSEGAYRKLAELYQAIGLTEVPAFRGNASAAARDAVTGAAAGGTANASTPSEMTNRDVIDLRAAGLDEDNLVAAIADAKAVRFDLSPAALKALLEANVSNRVIAAMRARMP